MQIAFGCTGCHVGIRFRIKLALRKTEGRKSKRTVPVNIFKIYAQLSIKPHVPLDFQLYEPIKALYFLFISKTVAFLFCNYQHVKKILFFPLKMCWEEIIISRSLEVTDHASIFGSGSIFTFLLFAELLFSPLIVQ